MTTQLDQDKETDGLKNLISDVLRLAKREGATTAEVGASVAAGLSGTARLGDVETISFHRDKSLALTVYFGKKKGSASTSDTAAASLENMVKAACNIAKYTAEDSYAGLAEKEFMATEFHALDLYHPWAISPEQAIEKSIDCENFARGLDTRITNSEGVTLSSSEVVRAYGNSHGFTAAQSGSRHSMSCVMIAEENGDMQRDYYYTLARNKDNLIDSKLLAEIAVEKTTRRLGAKKITTRKSPVMLTPELTQGLLNTFFSAISGGNLYRKTTFLLDSLGKQIFPSFFQIHEDPHLIGGLASTNYDGEGVRVTSRDIVKDGVVDSYILSSYSARKLGMVTTGNAGGVHNISVSNSGIDRDALIRKMDRGLLVTEMMGQGINLVTGDYSRGASGYWVENGEIQHPVHEITIAGNLRDMFAGVVAVANDTDYRSHIMTGSILLDEMTIAGA